MLIEKFIEYRDRCPEDQFNDFCDKYIDQFRFGGVLEEDEILKSILYQIYQLQVCMEGIIEDQDHACEVKSKEKTMKNDKKKKKVVKHLKGDIKGYKKEIKEDKGLIASLESKKKK